MCCVSISNNNNSTKIPNRKSPLKTSPIRISPIHKPIANSIESYFYYIYFFLNLSLCFFSSWNVQLSNGICWYSMSNEIKKNQQERKIKSFFFCDFSLSVPHTISPHRSHSWWNSFFYSFSFVWNTFFFSGWFYLCEWVALTIWLFVSLWRSIESLSSSPYVCVCIFSPYFSTLFQLIFTFHHYTQRHTVDANKRICVWVNVSVLNVNTMRDEIFISLTHTHVNIGNVQKVNSENANEWMYVSMCMVNEQYPNARYSHPIRT